MTLTPEQASQAAADGIAQADSAVTDAWRNYADEFIADYLRTNPSLFTDDLWAAGLEPPAGGDRRALGARLQHAAAQGLMVDSGSARRSTASNGSLKSVWRSQIFEHPDGDDAADVLFAAQQRAADAIAAAAAADSVDVVDLVATLTDRIADLEQYCQQLARQVADLRDGINAPPVELVSDEADTTAVAVSPSVEVRSSLVDRYLALSDISQVRLDEQADRLGIEGGIRHLLDLAQYPHVKAAVIEALELEVSRLALGPRPGAPSPLGVASDHVRSIWGTLEVADRAMRRAALAEWVTDARTTSWSQLTPDEQQGLVDELEHIAGAGDDASSCPAIVRLSRPTQ